MSNTRRQGLRRQKPGKRVDLTNIAKTMEQLGFARGLFSCLGVVKEAEDGGLHFDLDGEDLTVDVELQPSGTTITARLGTVGGSFGAGVWWIPPIGSEVLVAVPDGDIDFQPIIVAQYSSGSVPSDVEAGSVVIACAPGTKIYLHDGSGGADPLPTLNEFKMHTHPTGVGPSGPTIDPIPGVGPITGTTVVEAK